MPEKIIIGISVENKIAKADKNAVIVCGNSNYKAVFDFDSEWADYPIKTAVFATDNTDDNKPIAVVFNGNECDIPQLSNTTIVGVGVVSGDLTVDDQVEVSTTTPAYVNCLLSIKDLGDAIAPPAPDVYDQIIALLNKYIQQGGGGSGGGGTDEERVREIVAEETADLQAKTDEGLETESKLVVGAINELKSESESNSTEIAVINTVLEQSGLVSKYKATIEDTYSERVTADGANVLDGSKAKLEKVVGSTVACKNLVDIPFIDATTVQQSIAVNFVQDLFVSVGELATVVASVWRFSFTQKNGEIIYVYDKELEGGGKKISATADNPIVKVAYSSDHINAGQYSKIMIAYGDTATFYQPYFTGLKSASFAGIESTNADGTETSTLAFPKTPTPLGVTIDFENKKITNTYADYTFTGDEAWSKGTSAPSGLERWYCSIPNMASASVTGNNYNYGVCDRYSTVLTHTEYNAIKTRAVMFGYANNNFQFVCEIGQTAQSVQELTRGMAVRYLLDPAYHTSTNFTTEQSASGNEYTAYKGGTEKVLENDGNEYGAENTLSQNYIIVTGVK